ncbi:MAG: SIR2 family protein [Bacteroidales bacterium]|nr:SIR2 family protein [Bacteroidales bacterium]
MYKDKKRRVFVLGAGASKHATRNLDIPIPLAREFFKSEYVNTIQNSSHLKDYCFYNSSLNKFIQGFFNVKSKKKFSNKKYHTDIDSDVNIEEVYSFLEFIEQGDYYFHDEISLVNKAKKELLQFLFNVLEEYHYQQFDRELYENISKSLTEADTIITYNWDCIIESVLNETKIGKKTLNNTYNLLVPIQSNKNLDFYDYAFNNYHKPYFLKLHGSINWYNCKDKSCVRHTIPAVFNIDGDFHGNLWTCDYCGSLLNLMIIPPHAHKSYRTNRVFSLQAKIASDKLQNADEIIIIGYSFPDFDFEANSLFRRAIIEYGDLNWYKNSKKIITIVNPEINSPQYIDKVCNLFSLNKKERKNLKTFESIDNFNKNYTWK